MNREYLDDYEKVLDVYATTTLPASAIIESQFRCAFIPPVFCASSTEYVFLSLASSRNPGISESAYSYNSQLLNDSVAQIDALLSSNALSVNGNVPINLTSSVDALGDDLDFSTDIASDSATPSSSTVPATRTATSTSSTVTTLSTTSSGSLRQRKVTMTSSVASAATSGVNYLAAVMAARNNTVGGLLTVTATPTATQAASSGGPNTGLAMIVRRCPAIFSLEVG
jgi:hypothetical protein